MNITDRSTGCRMITVNANSTCPSIRNRGGLLTDLFDKIAAIKVDIIDRKSVV